ncbi:MAG: trypsin-like peptidase domain-containing protein [Fimbriimonadaceae bacterium]|nr:trypsin-like peptidase domain-containing protein [Fimbriimonadaceae bacterium]
MKRATWIAGLSAAVAFTAGCMSSAPAQTSAAATPAAQPPISAVAATSLPGIENALTKVYETVSPSVVNIQVLKKAPRTNLEMQFPNIPGMPDFGLPFPDQGQGQGQPNTPRQRRRQQPQTPPDNYAAGSGSGFVWDKQGHIVSNNHVVGDADKIQVTFSDGTQVPAKLVGADPDSDLAVIKVELAEGRLPAPVSLADSTQVKVGQLAVAIGNPFGLEGTMTVGFISALGRLLPIDIDRPGSASYTIPDVIQTDAPINPGNSGGVLTNSGGEVVGVPSAIISPGGASAGIGFAIPASIVKKVVPTLISKGSYEHPWLGISGITLSPDMAKAMKLSDEQRGALVIEVLAGSPADKAGVQGSDKQIMLDGEPLKVGGDVVTEFAGEPIKRFDDIVAALARHCEVGQTVKATVLRGGKSTGVELTLQARPNSKKRGPQVAEAAAKDGGASLGIGGVDVEQRIAKAMKLPAGTKGVLVSELDAGGAADTAGLKGSTRRLELDGEEIAIGGDVIVGWGDQPVNNLDDLEAKLAAAKPGDKIVLKVLRDGKPTNVTVTLGTAE